MKQVKDPELNRRGKGLKKQYVEIENENGNTWFPLRSMREIFFNRKLRTCEVKYGKND